MEYIRVTKENLEKEHICCAISNNKDIQVSSKKAWLADRFDEGLVFLKSVERGKCFIEYIPAECAWNPIEAPGYMYINCLWVSGSFKGHGYSSDLLSECIEDSKEKGKKGLCILAAARKKPFLADSKFLKYKGFKKKAEAEAMDIAHATPFAYASKIKAGDYADLNGCEVVIVTAGANQKPGQSRTDLLAVNVKIFEDIIPQVVAHAPDCILLIASNPVDIMTAVALKLSGFPKERVFGSGTTLDTARFRTLLGYHLGVSPKSIHANVLGRTRRQRSF